MDLGIGVALACAVLTQVGFLCKHRGANHVADVKLNRPLRSAASLFGSKWFAAGMGVAVAAWILHVAALTLAPLSVVQAVLATGVVILAVVGDRLFGCRVGRQQWLGVAMTSAGLLTLVLTLPTQDGAHAAFGLPALLAFEMSMLALGALLIAAPRLGAPDHHHGAMLGAAAGTLFGVSDVAVKALTGVAADGVAALVMSPWLPVAGIAAALAFLASARGFQRGDALPVIASTSTAANVTCILGGIVVFGDALAGGVLFAVQIAAFVVIAMAAIVTPAGHGRPVAATAS